MLAFHWASIFSRLGSFLIITAERKKVGKEAFFFFCGGDGMGLYRRYQKSVIFCKWQLSREWKLFPLLFLFEADITVYCIRYMRSPCTVYLSKELIAINHILCFRFYFRFIRKTHTGMFIPNLCFEREGSVKTISGGRKKGIGRFYRRRLNKIVAIIKKKI